jgi:hypothetical protein
MHIHRIARNNALLDRHLDAAVIPTRADGRIVSPLEENARFEGLWLSCRKSSSETSWIEGDSTPPT